MSEPTHEPPKPAPQHQQADHERDERGPSVGTTTIAQGHAAPAAATVAHGHPTPVVTASAEAAQGVAAHETSRRTVRALGARPSAAAPSAPARPTIATAPTAAPAKAPVRAAPAAGASDAVEQFMNVNWDDKTFWRLVAQVGPPGGAPKQLVSELDRWLPPGITPEQRTTIRIATTIGKSLIDGRAKDFLHGLPLLGQWFTLWDGLAETKAKQDEYAELKDPVGEGIVVARGMITTAREMFENALAPLEGIQGAYELFAGLVKAAALAAATTGVGAVPGVAAVEAVGVIDEPLKALLEGFGIATQLAQGVEGGLTFLEAVNAAYHVGEARATNQFERADVYTHLLQGAVIDGIETGIELGVGVAQDVSGALELGTVGVFDAELFVEPAATVLLGITSVTHDAIQTVREDLATTDTPFTLPGGPTLGGSAMQSRTPFVPHPVPTSDPALTAAQGATATEANAAQAAAQAHPPEWSPKVVAELATRPPFDFATAHDKLRPSYWIEQFATLLRQDGTLAGAGALDGIGSAIDALGGVLQPGIDLVRNGLQAYIATHLPHLQKLATGVNAQLQATEVNLGFARTLVGQCSAMIAHGQTSLAGVRVLAGKLTTDAVLKLQSMRVKTVPPVPGAAQAAAVINGMIDRAIANVMAVYATKVVPLEIRAAQLVGALQMKLQRLNAAIAKGGTVETQLQAEYKQLLALVAKATVEFGKVQVVLPRIDVRGAGSWLHALARSAQNAIAIERGQMPDPWQAILATTARPAVDAWKQTEGPNVERGYVPQPSAAEAAVVAGLVARARTVMQRVPAPLAQLMQAQIDPCLANIAQRGLRGRIDGWTCEARLVSTVEMLEHFTPGPP